MQATLSKGFPGGVVFKNLPASAGDTRVMGSIPRLGRSHRKGKGYPLQYSGLENSMDCIVHGVTKSWIRLNHFHKHHSYYFGLPRWLSGKESACQCRRQEFDPCVRKIPWRREWLPNPVFLPGEFHGQRSLVGYNP